VNLHELGVLVLRLVTAYGSNAWPFAIAHAVIVLFLVFSIRTLLRETRALVEWEPGREGGAMAASILASFVADSSRLGERGFVVPMTDYSDRVDSQIQNIVDEISERTNMLLIVGIAGTLFGVFEFAARTQSLRVEDRLALMGGILADSIAKAFPVGFIGLVLMLLFQLTLALPVSRLHHASSDATRRALEHRGEVSQTLADAIAGSIAESIAESMRPVSTLGETVSEHLQPIVVTLGDRLEESLSLVKTQFGAIDQSTRRFTDATSHLQKSAVAMTSTSDELRRVMASAPSVLAKTAELQDLQRRALEQIQAAFTRDLQIATHVTETLDHVTTAIASLPEELVRQATAAVRGSFDEVATRSIESWQTLSENLRAEMQLQTASLVIETREEIQNVQRQVAAAAAEWGRLATRSESLISTPLAKALSVIERSTSEVADKYTAVAGSLEAVQLKLATLPDDLLRQTGSAIGPAFENIANVSMETWHELVGKVAVGLQQDFTAYVAETFEQVSRATGQMHAAGEEMQRVAENTIAFLTEPVKTAIESARTEAAGALANIDDFVRQTYPALKGDMDRFAAELRTATEALAKTGERIRTMPTENKNKGQDEVIAVLREISERLEQMQKKPFQWHRLLPNHWFDQ
jgi:ABC-type transporter Mla subunit MlaD